MGMGKGVPAKKHQTPRKGKATETGPRGTCRARRDELPGIVRAEGPEVVADELIIGPQAQRFAVVGNRRGGLPEVLQRHAEVRMRGGRGRVEPQRGLIGPARLLEATKAELRVAEVVGGRGILGIQA